MKRGTYIDFLRFLGLASIILAHTYDVLILKQLRAFDVCLMVFVSGLAAGTNPIMGYKEYIRKRSKRLVFRSGYSLSPISHFLSLYILFKEL